MLYKLFVVVVMLVVLCGVYVVVDVDFVVICSQINEMKQSYEWCIVVFEEKLVEVEVKIVVQLFVLVVIVESCQLGRFLVSSFNFEVLLIL